MLVILVGALAFVQGITAHVGAYGPGMYCRNGLKNENDVNSFEVSTPLYQLPFDDWWLRGRCKDFPPPEGEFLNLIAGQSFMVELAANRAMTQYFGATTRVSDWPDGKDHPELQNPSGQCITDPNLHTTSENAAAGTAFSISYTSDIHAVTEENLVVFSVLQHTPWKREVHYQVPKAMPPCPKGGCICAYGWVPNGCGEPNEYMNPFRCNVTYPEGVTPSTAPVGLGKPPVWCEGDKSKCVTGPKQMIYWHQQSGNNVEVPDGKSPGYNENLGFYPGAQDDIFESQSKDESPSPSPLPSTSSVLDVEGTPASSNIPSATNPPPNSGTTTSTTRTRPSNSSCPRTVSRRDIAAHKRRHARRQSN